MKTAMSEDKDDKWEMPKPVFRTTSGALPKSFEKTISTSFMPNAETIKMEEDDRILAEDDDILGIMGPSEGVQAEKQTAYFDDEAITLTPDTEPEAGAPEEASTADSGQAQPVVVTAKAPAAKYATEPSGTPSYLIFIVLTLIAAAIVAGVLYFRSLPVE